MLQTHVCLQKAKKKIEWIIARYCNSFENPYIYTIFPPSLAHCKMRVTHFLNSQTSPTLIMLLERFLHAYYDNDVSCRPVNLFRIYSTFRRPRLECVVLNSFFFKYRFTWMYSALIPCSNNISEVFVQISSFFECFF